MNLDLNDFEVAFEKNGKYFECIDKSIVLDYYNRAVPTFLEILFKWHTVELTGSQTMLIRCEDDTHTIYLEIRFYENKEPRTVIGLFKDSIMIIADSGALNEMLLIIKDYFRKRMISKLFKELQIICNFAPFEQTDTADKILAIFSKIDTILHIDLYYTEYNEIIIKRCDGMNIHYLIIGDNEQYISYARVGSTPGDYEFVHKRDNTLEYMVNLFINADTPK